MADHMDIESADEDGRLHLNGIDALTGLPAVPPMTEDEAARRAGGGPPAEDVGLLRRLWEALKRPLHGLPDDIDPTDVAAAGWAVVLPTETPDEVRQAVEQLVAHRRDHTRVPADRCLILEYRPGQSACGLAPWPGGPLGRRRADPAAVLRRPGRRAGGHLVRVPDPPGHELRCRPDRFRPPRAIPAVRRGPDRVRDGRGGAERARGPLLGASKPG